jgi:hypothetical protein
MVPRQQSSLSTSAAVRNDVTDCRLTAERSNQLDVPTQRLRSVPPVVREAGGWISRVSRQRYVRICHRPRTGIRCWSFHRCSSLGRDMPGNCEKIAKRRRPGDDARMTTRISPIASVRTHQLRHTAGAGERCGSKPPVCSLLANGRSRRTSPIAVSPPEGPLTEPTAGAQPLPRERVLMPEGV